MSDIPEKFLKQHQEYLNYFTNIYSENVKNFKYYHDNPKDPSTKFWEEILRLMPEKFCQRFQIKPIKDKHKLIKNVNSSKQTLDYHFNMNEDCNLSDKALKRCFDNEEHGNSEQLELIMDKVEHIKKLLEWPYEPERNINDLPQVHLGLEYGRSIQKVRKTMFITPSLLYRFVALIEDKFDLFLVEHFPSKENFCTFDDKSESSIPYKFEEDYGKSERAFLKKVFEEWIQLKPNKVEFKNVLFITHFSASLLRILASCYEVLSVDAKGSVKLEHMKKELMSSQCIEQLRNHLEGSSSERITCLTEPNYVNKGVFFVTMTNYNAQLLIHYMNETFEFLKSKMSNE